MKLGADLSGFAAVAPLVMFDHGWLIIVGV
jgi:hypothetical protein